MFFCCIQNNQKVTEGMSAEKDALLNDHSMTLYKHEIKNTLLDTQKIFTHDKKALDISLVDFNFI